MTVSTPTRNPGDPIPITTGDGPVSFKLDLSPEAYRRLDRLVKDSGQSVSDILRKALALYGESYEAHLAGKAIGIAKDPESLEVEFVGFEPSPAR
jgi:predicted transcriptional regulator